MRREDEFRNGRSIVVTATHDNTVPIEATEDGFIQFKSDEYLKECFKVYFEGPHYRPHPAPDIIIPSHKHHVAIHAPDCALSQVYAYISTLAKSTDTTCYPFCIGGIPGTRDVMWNCLHIHRRPPSSGTIEDTSAAKELAPKLSKLVSESSSDSASYPERSLPDGSGRTVAS